MNGLCTQVHTLQVRSRGRGYLATIGRDKVGFSIVGKAANGAPVYVDNLRGVLERNTMRYYLAIEAYEIARQLVLAKAAAPG